MDPIGPWTGPIKDGYSPDKKKIIRIGMLRLDLPIYEYLLINRTFDSGPVDVQFQV